MLQVLVQRDHDNVGHTVACALHVGAQESGKEKLKSGIDKWQKLM